MTDSSDNEAPAELSPYVLNILRDIAAEDHYYAPLSLAHDDPLRLALRTLESMEYIHWCPYPEEFYIIRRAGLAALGRRDQGL
jgi:hypothetical protein